MLALLTLTMAHAEQTEDASAARRALIEAAAICCNVPSTAPAATMVPMKPQRNRLRMSPGHTLRGANDYLGGAPLTEQLVAVDGVPMMIDGLQPFIVPRSGAAVSPPNIRLVPRPSPPHPW